MQLERVWPYSFAPALVAAAILICFASPDSRMFVQTRVGHYGRRISAYKPRMMVVEKHERTDRSAARPFTRHARG